MDAGLLRSPQSAVVEVDWRLRENQFGNAGQQRPGDLRVSMPKASARKFHQSNGSRLDNTLLALRKDSRVLRHRRAFADCFGANPVASALGNRPGATPVRLCEHTMRAPHWPSEPELSTWLETGTFYLAPTRARREWPARMPRSTHRHIYAAVRFNGGRSTPRGRMGTTVRGRASGGSALRMVPPKYSSRGNRL